MPNWCKNKLEILSTQLDVIKKDIKGANGDVDFHKIIPIPKGLTREKLTKVQKVSNKSIYGYNDWYDFCVDKWGTKWNASNIKKGDDGSLFFDTAWVPPIPVIQELSRKYPESSFRIKYADEDSIFIGFSDIIDGVEQKYDIEVDSEDACMLQAELNGEKSKNEGQKSKKKKKSTTSSILDKPFPVFVLKERFEREMLERVGGDEEDNIYEQILKQREQK